MVLSRDRLSQGPGSGQVTDYSDTYGQHRMPVDRMGRLWKHPRPEDGYLRLNDRASALSGSAGSLIETSQLDSQPVAGRPVNHSRLKDRIDKVTGTRPAGSSFLVNPPPGLWEVVGTRAQSERVSSRGGTFHSRRPFHCRHRIRVSATSSR